MQIYHYKNLSGKEKYVLTDGYNSSDYQTLEEAKEVLAKKYEKEFMMVDTIEVSIQELQSLL